MLHHIPTGLKQITPEFLFKKFQELFVKCGVEGSRTPVQTMLPLIFYMLIVLLLVGK